MKRALQLATLGKGNVSPNPMVGAVIVHNDQIIGEGYHQKYGQPHAEVNAVASVSKENLPLLSEAEIYVTLEPCSHYGKTPPCADLLVKHNFKKVIVCNLDPNPLVAGRGIKRLEDAGIKVATRILENEGLEVNKRFFKAMTEKKPFVLLKYAQTSDGFVARENFDSKWISNPLSRQLVHKMRAEEDAILVGTNTAKYDDPALNVRAWAGKDPLRVVIDRSKKLDDNLKLFDNSIRTICYTSEFDEEKENLAFIPLNKETFLEDMLVDLFSKGIHSIIVEGGSTILKEFIDRKLWDEAHVFTSSSAAFGSGIEAPLLPHKKRVQVTTVEQDEYAIYKALK
ncbi:bifunctional diaminohydroxyphosphoribosylaminopyrimidine deaminase/5-amino-6-(5-phosphoribosylamino)uracil reductase RibD [Flammeovirga kamogawensis]|uniref:Riboflavin biosynthesis protein RibD n=2 Tax=Flammeovirga kamogawensis TaxID=373891 RepID=A0ABX8H0N4_9BACT|nr:bifunctional diaminohydroxyphosphoribosylaminopyrimidine deaminase/5-amino-6-(5-phosphoribosylamino)uracil reductase RibD [Flammeovirga kamogawensis]TRX70100.1 bifunctional diaminohydroxyphosphoribosylaminopyrimidine deaminase/5-amino-6-(5-phosphoribosylamino)uracil reductase RibD [Flammeovirga kamogawensis]